MKTTKLLLAIAALGISFSSFAQVKIGNNPTTINAGSVLELESTNKGLLLPRIALTNTTTWGLLGTSAAGMHVYNTNVGITSGTTAGGKNYPVLTDKVGEYYWDGTGWVALGRDGFTSPVQVKMNVGPDQNLAINSVFNTINFPTTEYDVSLNKVGNTVVIPTPGLYNITSAVYWAALGGSGGAWGLYVNINGVDSPIAGGSVVYGVSDFTFATVYKRLNAGDVVMIRMLTQQTAGTFTVRGSGFLSVIKVSN